MNRYFSFTRVFLFTVIIFLFIAVSCWGEIFTKQVLAQPKAHTVTQVVGKVAYTSPDESTEKPVFVNTKLRSGYLLHLKAGARIELQCANGAKISRSLQGTISINQICLPIPNVETLILKDTQPAR